MLLGYITSRRAAARSPWPRLHIRCTRATAQASCSLRTRMLHLGLRGSPNLVELVEPDIPYGNKPNPLEPQTKHYQI